MPVDQSPKRKNRKTLVASVAVVLAAAAGAGTLFLRQHGAQARQVEQLEKDLSQGPVVRVATVTLGAAERLVSLPAEVRADQHATLYAKVSGYVKRVMVDKGSRVRKGDVLAELESPDLDEQVASTQAEMTFRKQQLERTGRLASSGRVSQQDREQAEEAVKLAQAALARARVQKSYQVLRAPFDGTITARYADPGALLPAATGSTSSAQPLLEIAQLDRLRIALQLAQDDAARVQVGDAVKLSPGGDEAPLTAKVSRIAHALDARTRTMLCEIDLPHPPAGLYPGAFVVASIALHGAARPLVPADALLGKSGQLYVPTVLEGHVHFQHVRLGLDDGANVEVLEGLRGGEVVALNLATDVPDGAAVRVAAR